VATSGANVTGWTAREGGLVLAPAGTVTFEASDATLGHRPAIACAAASHLAVTNAAIGAAFDGNKPFYIAMQGYIRAHARLWLLGVAGGRVSDTYSDGVNYQFFRGTSNAVAGPVSALSTRFTLAHVYDGTSMYYVSESAVSAPVAFSSSVTSSNLFTLGDFTSGSVSQLVVSDVAIGAFTGLTGATLANKVQQLLQTWRSA